MPTVKLSEAARKPPPRRVAGERVQVAPDNVEAYRELERSGLMESTSGLELRRNRGSVSLLKVIGSGPHWPLRSICRIYPIRRWACSSLIWPRLAREWWRHRLSHG